MQISALFREPGQITVPLSSKILSGLTAGAIGITIATVRHDGDFDEIVMIHV